MVSLHLMGHFPQESGSSISGYSSASQQHQNHHPSQPLGKPTAQAANVFTPLPSQQQYQSPQQHHVAPHQGTPQPYFSMSQTPVSQPPNPQPTPPATQRTYFLPQQATQTYFLPAQPVEAQLQQEAQNEVKPNSAHVESDDRYRLSAGLSEPGLALEGDDGLTSRPTFRRRTAKKPSGMSAAEIRNKIENLRAEVKNNKSSKQSMLKLAKFLIENTTSIEDRVEREGYKDEGFKMYVKLTRSGVAEAQFYLGKAFAEDGKYTLAYQHFAKAAKQGYPSAMHALAACYENGKGCRIDQKSAFHYYTKAAQAGHSLSMYRIGTAMLNGELGQPINTREGVKWYRRCAAGM
jgi:TPR repeat protein